MIHDYPIPKADKAAMIADAVKVTAVVVIVLADAVSKVVDALRARKGGA